MRDDSQQDYVLAVDHGTSAMKVALANMRGDVLALECAPIGLQLRPGGGAEQDPGEWWSALVKCSRGLLERGLVPVDRIRAVCCSSQWSGTVPVDREGHPIGNALIWMDSRGAPYVKAALRGLINVEGYGILNLVRWLRKTAGIPSASGKDPIAHIMYLKHERPDVYRDTYKFLECKDYLNLALTGEFAASFDSIALHWVADIRNIDRVHYDSGLAKKLGIHLDKLPALRRATDILGTVTPDAAHEIGVKPDTKVITGSPDVQSAIVGSGAVRDYEGHIYIGTSSWLTCHVPFKKTDIFHNMATLPSPIPGRYFVANEQETAGACLTFIRDSLLFPDDSPCCGDPGMYREFDRICETAPPGSHRMIFTPWLYGERTPVEDHAIRGGLFNISLEVKRCDVIRAVFEGVAYNSRWLLGLVERFVGRRMDALNIIGGGAQSDIWCQIYADVLNRRIRRVADPIQANARGAALIASMALGYVTPDEIPSTVRISRVFEPNPENRKIYDQLYSEFLHLYRQNREMYHRLNAPVKD